LLSLNQGNLKNVCLEDPRPSLFCSTPPLVSRYWKFSEIWHLLIGQMVESFSDSLKVASVSVTTEESFLIGSFKVSIRCVVIG